nr:M20/M25/M40 family metallo-hydrolase [Chloroflexota bacterium]
QAISVHRLRITANAAGGHSWSDFGQPSAVHGLVQLAAHLTAIPLPASPKTILNIGQISGGTSVNTIAREAALELDLRSEDTAALAVVVEEVEQAVRKFGTRGIGIAATVTGQRPAGAIPREHPLVQLATAALQAVGAPPTYERGSTDANIPLSQNLPAVCIGLCRGGNAHRPDEYIEPALLENGLKQLMYVALGAFEL